MVILSLCLSDEPCELLQWLGWLCGTMVEHRSVTGELPLSYAQPAADG